MLSQSAVQTDECFFKKSKGNEAMMGFHEKVDGQAKAVPVGVGYFRQEV